MSNGSIEETRLPGGKECYICGRLHKTDSYLCEECLDIRPFTIKLGDDSESEVISDEIV